MSYKDLVQEIASLPWGEVTPEDLIILSRGTAIEFAESLRAALQLYPDDSRLKEMAEGELETHNMDHENYVSGGDHWRYLDFFIEKHNIKPSSSKIIDAIKNYTGSVREMNPEYRAMTVFSREEELVHIFHKIILAHDWDALGYGFYKHYLEAHIMFDSGEGGHHHLTEHFPLHQEILDQFYQIRLKLYGCLFE